MDGTKMKRNTSNLTMIGLFIALICIATMFFKIPIPYGYAHLGNGFIFLAAALTGNYGAMIAAGFGSALADMLGGWYQWVLPTLIIKSIMGLVTAFIMPKPANLKLPATFLAVFLGALVMVLGYTIAGSIMYGSVAAGVAQIPGLVAENVVGIVLFYLVGFRLFKANASRFFNNK